jgi:hypothetical protein
MLLAFSLLPANALSGWQDHFRKGGIAMQQPLKCRR